MNKLIAIIGPTAVGKTALSFTLAEKLHTDLVSGDAYQIYKHMDIGTAKPTPDELKKYHHYLIDIIEPDIAFSAFQFQKQAEKAIAAIQSEHKIPILVGGTGLYVQALLEGYAFHAPMSDASLRAKASTIIGTYPANKLKEYIQAETQWEPDDWHELLSNTNRLTRLIAAILAGHGYDHVRAEKNGSLVYDAYVIGLMLPRDVLYQRIESRVDAMLSSGWIEEVEALIRNGVSHDSQAMKAIGYSELAAYVQGQMSLEAAAESIKKRTRHFAKRQITWYKRMPYIHWYHKNEFATEQELATAVYDDIRKQWHE